MLFNTLDISLVFDKYKLGHVFDYTLQLGRVGNEETLDTLSHQINVQY